MLGIIDAGGTTFKCAIVDRTGSILARTRVITRDPEATITGCINFFRNSEQTMGSPLIGFGLACFGPLDVDPNSPRIGEILNTPKIGWIGANVKNALVSEFGVDVAVDTDVNAALLGEWKNGSAYGAERAAYVTVGTGIGAGFLQNGRLLAKPLHAEFGHIPVKRHPSDSFAGCCSFHGDCLEGMASAKSFEARWGRAEEVPADHEAWCIEAYYLAQLCVSINLMLRAERIVLGGGLMQAPQLLSLVRTAYVEIMAGYLGESRSDIESMIVLPKHGDDAGLMGALQLARTRLRL